MATNDLLIKGVAIAELTGLGETLRRINEARDCYLDSEVRAAYSASMRAIAASVRKFAPVNRYPYVASIFRKKRSGYWTPTSQPGLLRSSIRGAIFSIGSWRRWGPGGFAEVRLRRGTKPFAPHAHLVEHGRDPVKAKNGKKRLSFFGTSGRLVFMKGVGEQLPSNFWARGVRAAEQVAIRRAEVSLERAWNKRVRG